MAKLNTEDNATLQQDLKKVDFSETIAYFRSVDLTKYMGGDRGDDPAGKGQHLKFPAIFLIFLTSSLMFWVAYFAVYKCIAHRVPSPDHGYRIANYIVSTLHALFACLAWF